MIDAITDSRNRTSQEIRHLLSSHGGTMATPGSVMWLFEKYGEIVAAVGNANRADLELLAIEAGAEDVQSGESDAITILTRPEDLYRVKKFLEE
ncbi:YebC/PmpR family DNA-binding transcriptional regulator, partial [Candidatus Azambacteria bacterium]|nr:YebC/PmpR family DNA-binding transcriptional regulator [Candidatus Azambacteria bacterium]